MRQKVKFEKQLDISDCGLACLKMICSIYDKDYSLSYLRSIIHTGKDGVSLLEISKATELLGFKTSGGLFSLENFDEKADLPCILHLNQNHFVVLYRIRNQKKKQLYYIADPGKGLLKLSKEELLKCWEVGNRNNSIVGVGLLFELTNNLYEQNTVEVNQKNS